jgi:cysteinyl-tRNA synthetase
MKWDSPWGEGFPGWHIECSAMSMKYLGERFDIHTGGVDLIFPHHEDEIAQSCAYTGQPDFAKVWMHGEFLNVRGTKMSKRFGNITTARDLKNDGVDAGAIRLLMFQAHYRQKLDLTDEALSAARRATERLGEFARRLNDPDLAGQSLTQRNSVRASTDLRVAATLLEKSAAAALNDDLDAPKAIATIFDFLNSAHRAIDEGASVTWEARETFNRLANLVFDILPSAKSADDGLKAWVEKKLEVRREAKKKRDFATADAIRAELGARGVVIEDTAGGTKWRLA